jgi:hypothetical protein
MEREVTGEGTRAWVLVLRLIGPLFRIQVITTCTVEDMDILLRLLLTTAIITTTTKDLHHRRIIIKVLLTATPKLLLLRIRDRTTTILLRINSLTLMDMALLPRPALPLLPRPTLTTGLLLLDMVTILRHILITNRTWRIEDHRLKRPNSPVTVEDARAKRVSV